MTKASCVVLLWLLSASATFAAQGPPYVRAKVCDPQTQATSIKKLARQLRAVGGPLARRHPRSRLGLTVRTSHFHRASQTSSSDDNEAIQNDAPVAHVAVDPVCAPLSPGVFVDVFEQQPFTLTSCPRSPRGPPMPA